MNPRELLKRKLVNERGYCHAVFIEAECAGGLEMHEAFYTRGHAVTAAQKKYMNDERNCVLVCHVHHGMVQHSKAFRAYWKQRAVELYGSESVDAYLAGWPTKLRRA